jgi:hypothetical protein
LGATAHSSNNSNRQQQQQQAAQHGSAYTMVTLCRLCAALSC